MKIIDKCPKPRFNTGCTYCDVNFTKPISYDNLNLTKVLPSKHLLYLSHGLKDISQLPSKYNNFGLLGDIHNLSTTHKWDIKSLNSFLFLEDHKQVEVEGKETIYLYPDNVKIEFDATNLKKFMVKYLITEKIKPVYNPFKPNDTKQIDLINEEIESIRNEITPQDFNESKIINNLWLICGHGNRDERCGTIAPYLINELKQIKSPKDQIGVVSHIGGHAYAGNVIIYPENIWYGRVMPDKIQGIYESYNKGEIIQELYRGDLTH